MAIDEGEILNSGDKAMINLSVNQEEAFGVGDRIKVSYDGVVMESYPLKVNEIFVEKID